MNCKSLKFEYAGAGHPQPLLLDESHKPIPVPHTLGQAIGIFDHFELDEESISLPECGTLLLYSDGLSETIEDQPGSPELIEMCGSIVNSKEMNAQAFCEGLWKAAGKSSAESLIKDDFTVIVVKSRKKEGS